MTSRTGSRSLPLVAVTVSVMAVLSFACCVHAWQTPEEALEAELAGKTHYEVLGLPPTATLAEIKKAFRVKSLELHPDKHTHESEAKRAEAQVRFLRVVEAWDTLKDERSRQWYDLKIKATKFHTFFTFSSSPPSGRSTSSSSKGSTTTETIVEMNLEAKLMLWIFLFLASVCVTLGCYLNIVIVYAIYSVLYRLKHLWKYVVLIIFAYLVSITPTEVKMTTID